MLKKAISVVGLPLVMSVAWPAVARAQQQGTASDTPRVYVGASVFSTTRPAGQPDYICCTPMFGGTTGGVGGTVGFSMGAHLSFAVEGSWVGGLSGPIASGHYGVAERSTASETETMVGLLVRGHPMKNRVRVEPLGGMFISFETISLTDRQSIQYTYSNGPVTTTVTPLPDVSATNVHFGLGVGADVVVDLTRSMALTGSFRYARFWDRYVQSPRITNAESVGVGNDTFQFGAGLRRMFQ